MTASTLFRKLIIGIGILLLPISSFSYEPKAKQITTDVTNFTGNLSSADTEVQHALDTIDNLSIVTTESDPLSIHLNQSSPQTLSGGAFAGSGLIKITSGILGVNTSTYLTTNSASSTYVPYTGASYDVNLGNNNLTAKRGLFNGADGDAISIVMSSQNYKALHAEIDGAMQADLIDCPNGLAGHFQNNSGVSKYADLGTDYLAGHFQGDVVIGDILGVGYDTYTSVPLNMINSVSQESTQLNLINIFGGMGAGSFIDFYTYTDAGNGLPGAEFGSVDDGDFSGSFIWRTKDHVNEDGTDVLINRMMLDSYGGFHVDNDGSVDVNGISNYFLKTDGAGNVTLGDPDLTYAGHYTTGSIDLNGIQTIHATQYNYASLRFMEDVYGNGRAPWIGYIYDQNYFHASFDVGGIYAVQKNSDGYDWTTWLWFDDGGALRVTGVAGDYETFADPMGINSDILYLNPVGKTVSIGLDGAVCSLLGTWTAATSATGNAVALAIKNSKSGVNAGNVGQSASLDCITVSEIGSIKGGNETFNLSDNYNTKTRGFLGFQVRATEGGVAFDDSADVMRLTSAGDLVVGVCSANQIGADWNFGYTPTQPSPDWTYGTGWTHVNGQYQANHATNGTAPLTCISFTPVASTTYIIYYKLSSVTAGNITLSLGGISDVAKAVDGVYKFTGTTSSTAALLITPSNNFRGSVEFVDCLKITSTQDVYSNNITSTQFKLSALNTAPANAGDTGVLGEIRIDASYIYVCTATNTWKRAAIATW